MATASCVSLAAEYELKPLFNERGEGGLIGYGVMRAAASSTLGLDQRDTRSLLHTFEDDFCPVRRNIEISDHEARWQIGQLARRSRLRIQSPEVLAVDPAAEHHERPGVA